MPFSLQIPSHIALQKKGRSFSEQHSMQTVSQDNVDFIAILCDTIAMSLT